jgi:hypothetical protein
LKKLFQRNKKDVPTMTCLIALAWDGMIALKRWRLGKMSGLNVNMHQKPLARVEKMEISGSKSNVAPLFGLECDFFQKWATMDLHALISIF